MSVESPRIRSLLRQADNVAAVGKRAAAEQLYRQIIDEAPETAAAWRGLAQVLKNADERDAALERAQALDPDFEATAADREVEEEALPEEEGQTTEKESDAAFSKDGQQSLGKHSAPAAPARVDAEDHDAGDSHTHEAADFAISDLAEETETLVCANHPGRQTHLRCNRCGKPICSSCANPTPVGYRCPECIREQEDVYFTAGPIDYLVTALVALPLSLVIGWLAALILSSPFGFFLIFLGAFSGSLVGRVAFRAAGRRRGRWLPHLAVACVIVGGVLPSLAFIMAAFLGQFSLRLLFLGIYLVAAAGATYYQMR